MNVIVFNWQVWAEAYIDEIVVVGRENTFNALQNLKQLVRVLAWRVIQHPVMINWRIGARKRFGWIDVPKEEGGSNVSAVLEVLIIGTPNPSRINRSSPSRQRMITGESTVENGGTNACIERWFDGKSQALRRDATCPDGRTKHPQFWHLTESANWCESRNAFG